MKGGSRVTKWLMFMVWFPTHSSSSPGVFVGKKRFGFLFGFLNWVSESPFVVTYLLKEFSGVYFLLLTFLEHTLSLLSHRSCCPVGPHTPMGCQHPSLQQKCPWIHSLPSLVLAFLWPWRITVNFSHFSCKSKALIKRILWFSQHSAVLHQIFPAWEYQDLHFPLSCMCSRTRGLLCWGSTGWAHPPVLAPGSWEGFPASAPPAMRCWGTALGY